jgi:hypothetical protein
MKKILVQLALLVVVAVIGLVAVIASLVWLETRDSSKRNTELDGENQKKEQVSQPAFIKNIGIDFTDFEFTNKKISFNSLFMDYGFPVPASGMGPAKLNPQPTFIVPLGTEVTSLVDGVVVGIPELYSGDYSVMVASNAKDDWIFETEHVIKPRVKVGDKVRAGQVVAEVSDFDSHNHGGFGMVEIGILHGGEIPEHVCPFAYLDPSIKASVEAEILNFYKKWEEFKGDTSIYNEAALVSPGCLTYEAIEG